MTSCPYYIGAQASLDEALKKMALQSIRHLPVVEGGSLIGVLSERDARLSEMVCKSTNYCPNVGEVCVSEFLAVKGDDDVADVAQRMAEKKLDCAIVCDKDENVTGIFTTTDACRLLNLAMKNAKSIKA